MPFLSTTVRAAHLLSNAAWFGGSVAGAVALNPAAAASPGGSDVEVAQEGWTRWQPVQATAIGVHLASGVAILADNRRRVVLEPATRATTVVKTAVTGLALTATALNAYLGREVGRSGGMGNPDDPLDPRSARNRGGERARTLLRTTQWVPPVLTGVLLVLDAQLGEQQRGWAGLLDA